MQELTKDKSILQITDKIREKEAQGRYTVSDIILSEGTRKYQFVDLVMEGGGTLGIALVGYIHALEEAGIRFLGMGGSSVGAIVALLAYSCSERMDPKGERLASIIGNMNLGEMVDGSFWAKRLSKLLGKRDAKMRTARIIFGALLTLPQIFGRLGLNPGDKLYEWISDRLAENKIHTFADLQRLIKSLPDGMIHRETGDRIIDHDTSLRIVAADVTTSTKVTFPDMAAMYWQEPDEVNPACFVRASASIPIFFQPFTVDGVSRIMESSDKWKRLGSFTGTLPDKVSFTDGGMLSNFPIDLFKRPGVPRAPTLGVRLGKKYRSAKETDKLGQYAWQLINALRHYADYDFIFKNPLYKDLIAHINTGGYNWLDFNMSPEDKLGLFREGVLAGHDFLETFDWEQHKKLRAAELAVYRASVKSTRH
ncbi:MAG: patatin-like phospholipase family protein [Syntrophobacterales bacterium]|jgi:NTE family protein|nr:patatin-like phospholipase family protein [Syntrophobacterales bacterium]